VKDILFVVMLAGFVGILLSVPTDCVLLFQISMPVLAVAAFWFLVKEMRKR
jgi:hypothetical protein